MPQGDSFKFTNVETPKSFIDFHFGDKIYRLEDGKIYKDVFSKNLGLWMSEHLNGLEVYETESDVDTKTGQYTTKVVGMRPRFSCTPVRLTEKKALKEAVG
jgi:hypothetical protein